MAYIDIAEQQLSSCKKAYLDQGKLRAVNDALEEKNGVNCILGSNDFEGNVSVITDIFFVCLW
jgi:hypothetical protein